MAETLRSSSLVAVRTGAGHDRTSFPEAVGWARERLVEVEVELGRREARLVVLDHVWVALVVTLSELLGAMPRGRAAS